MLVADRLKQIDDDRAACGGTEDTAVVRIERLLGPEELIEARAVRIATGDLFLLRVGRRASLGVRDLLRRHWSAGAPSFAIDELHAIAFAFARADQRGHGADLGIAVPAVAGKEVAVGPHPA